jgi:outer membrane protein TolC
VGIFAVLAVVSALPGRAQDGPLRLTLAEAIARGVQTSNRLAALQAQRDASEALVGGARSATQPQVSWQNDYVRTNFVDEFGILQPDGTFRVIYPDVPDNWRTRVDMQWPLYTGGRLEGLIAAARSDATAAARDLDAARTDLKLEIARAYWGLVTAREAVAVVEAGLARVEAYLVDARARFEAGFVPPNDVSSAEAQRSLEEALLIESRNAVSQAGLALARLIGVPPGTAIEPIEPLGLEGAPLEQMDALVAEARASRSDRAALVTRIEAAATRRTAAGAAARPSIVAYGGVDYARPNIKVFPRADQWRESWDVGINLSWSLYDGGRVRADVAAADAVERALRQRLEEFDTLVDLEVRQRWLDLQSSRARAAASADAVRSATDARRVLQDRYNAGVATSTEVLDAQVLQLEAELRRTRALAAARVAQAGLDRAIGRQP